MEEFARFLRENRQARGLSLDDMEARTKIKKRYLMAMEDGDFSQLPDAAYRRAFVRLYARELGLDIQDTLARYTNALQPSPAELSTRDESENQPLPMWQSLWVWFLLAAMLAAGVLGGWYASGRMELAQQRRSAPPAYTEWDAPMELTEEHVEMPEAESEPEVSYFGPDEAGGVIIEGD